MKTKKDNKKRNVGKKRRKKSKFLLLFLGKKNKYTFSDVFVITIVSLLIGIFASFSVITIFTGGRNIFKMSKDLGKFYDAYQVLIDNYYGDVDKDDLIDEAISGMASSVGDTYTSYVDEGTTNAFDQLVNGKYEGIGCTIMMDTKDKSVKVMEIYHNSPAEKAGLKVNDIIKKVDFVDVSKINVTKLSEYIRNEADDNISMTIVRDGEEIAINLKRGKVEIPVVNSEIYEGNNKKIGYISLSVFSSVSSKQFSKELVKLEKNNIDALIVDVRDNTGGYLTSVTDIVSQILPKGEIIYQIQKGKNKKAIKDKTSEKREYSIAVLVNSNSASASEIFAAAIKESYNGYVVGEKTYGKGTVQQVKKLNDGSMIKYTTNNWLTPKGNWINEVGVEPTDIIKLDEAYREKPIKENDNQLKKAIELVSK